MHYFIPFIIQVISMTVTMIQTAFSRTRATGNREQVFRKVFKKQFEEQKELYITPIIIIFSSLPQAILSFSYTCSELKES